jgi:hypothetical protein
MIIDFKPLVCETVPRDYSWDEGTPLELGLETATVSANTFTNYISGYAPFARVYFANVSDVLRDIPTGAKLYTNYEWDFGDYYNNFTNKVALSCPVDVRHTYIMPGKYTVTLFGTRSVSQQILDNLDELCFGKYNINWYWDRFVPLIAAPSAFNAKNFFNTWDETALGESFAKQWDDEFECYQKYCKYWSWENLQKNKNSQVTWDQAKNGAVFEKKWMYEANDTICSTKAPNWYTTTETEQQVAAKYFIIDIKELPPRAGMFCTSQILTGYTPHTIILTPRTTVCGSYPIDRIDWDFDDGSPILTVVRQNTVSRVLSAVNIVNTDQLTGVIVEKALTADFIDNLINISPYPNVYSITDNNYPEITALPNYTPSLTSTATVTYTTIISSLVTTISVLPMPGLIYNGFYFDDFSDPRNYDIEHTYHTNREIYPVFYPSLTAYSSSTNTNDSCSTIVGPVFLEEPKTLTPVKVINNQKETQYAYSAGETYTVLTTITAETKLPKSKIPSNRLVNDFYKPLVYRGNNGDNFIIDEPPNCAGYVLTADKTASGGIVYTGTALITQESIITTYEGVTAIAQENDDFILI